MKYSGYPFSIERKNHHLLLSFDLPVSMFSLPPVVAINTLVNWYVYPYCFEQEDAESRLVTVGGSNGFIVVDYLKCTNPKPKGTEEDLRDRSLWIQKVKSM